ncbi:MAG TPA: AMIN domain-containing protein, partial [Nitrospira sp.]
MTRTTFKTTIVGRTLAATAALSFLIAAPSMGGNAGTDFEVPPGHLQADQTAAAIDAGVAQTLTGIEIQRGDADISVLITGDGTLFHEETKPDQQRLVMDIPRVASVLRKSVVRVNHPLLKQIRLGHHSDKVRLVFDLPGKSDYSVEPKGTNLLVTFRDSIANDSMPTVATAEFPQSSTLATAGAGNAAKWEPNQNRSANRAKVVVHHGPSAFHVRPAQMMAEPDSGEKHTPKE